MGWLMLGTSLAPSVYQEIDWWARGKSRDERMLKRQVKKKRKNEINQAFSGFDPNRPDDNGFMNQSATLKTDYDKEVSRKI